MLLKNMCLLGLVISSILTVGCVSSTVIGTGSERKQLLLTNQTKIVKKADKQAAALFGNSEKIIYRGNERYLAGIMNKLIPYANAYSKDGDLINWEIHIDQSMKKINAGALANGLIVLSPEFMELHLTEDELAFIIAHEMAHVLRQHHCELSTWRYVTSPLIIGASLATGGSGMMVGLSGRDIYGIAFNKVTEREADRIGLEILSKAGYDPVVAMKVFESIKPAYKKDYPINSRMPFFLKSHPTLKARIKDSQKRLPEVISLKNQYAEKELEATNLIDVDKNVVQAPDIKFTVLEKPQMSKSDFHHRKTLN